MRQKNSDFALMENMSYSADVPSDLAAVESQLLRSLKDGGDSLRPVSCPPPAVPDHTLLRRIGGGSYGEVWLARNVVGTYRAVKVVYRERFGSARPYEREFQGMQHYEPVSRRHEGLVDILQIGRSDESAFFYYVMELADDAEGGPPLAAPTEDVHRAMNAAAGTRAETRPDSTWIGAVPVEPRTAIDPDHYKPRTLSSEIRRAGRMAPADCVQVFLTLTAALSTLHRCGLLHRDLKPSNIIIVDGMPKLADIGLVAEAGAEMTFVGTEGFIPPEGPGTAAADLFAMGRMFYEAFTGLDRMQFPSIPASPENMVEVKAMLELSAVAEKACATDPRKRYQSAEEMLADLALLHSGRSVQRMRMVETRLRKARRFGLAAAAAAVVAAGVVVVVQQRRAAERESRAILEDALAEARLQRAVAERVSGKAGARFAVLEAVSAAARSRPGDAALRTAAIAALAQPDVRERRVWPAEIADPCAVSWSADGALLAFAQKDGAVRVQRAADDAVAATLRDARPLRPLVVGNSGRFVFTTDAGSRLQLWDARAARSVWTLPPTEGNAVLDAAEQTLFIARPDGRCLVRDPVTGTEREVFRVSKWDTARTVLSNIAGTRVVLAAGRGRELLLLDFSTGRVVAEWTLPEGHTLFGLTLAPDGKKVRAGCAQAVIFLFDANEPERVVTSLKPAAPVLAGGFTPDGEAFVSSGWDSVTRLFETATCRQITTLPNWSHGLAFTGDGLSLLRCDGVSCALHAYDFAGSVCRVSMEPEGRRGDGGPTAPVLDAGGSLLATGSWQGLRLRHMHDGTLAALLPGQNAIISAVFRADGSILTASDIGLKHWPATRDESVLRIGTPHDINNTFTHMIHSDTAGRVIVRAAGDGITRALDGGEFEPLLPPPGSAPHPARIVTVSPDGKWIASCAGPMRVWNARTRALHWEPPHQWECVPVFSPDSKLLAGNDRARAWVADIEQKRLLWQTPQPEGAGLHGAWSPDGLWLVLARRPDSLTAFDARTGAVWAEITHPDTRPLSGVVFSRDGRQLIVTTTTGLTHYWQLAELRAGLKSCGLDLPLPEMARATEPACPLDVEISPSP